MVPPRRDVTRETVPLLCQQSTHQPHEFDRLFIGRRMLATVDDREPRVWQRSLKAQSCRRRHDVVVPAPDQQRRLLDRGISRHDLRPVRRHDRPRGRNQRAPGGADFIETGPA